MRAVLWSGVAMISAGGFAIAARAQAPTALPPTPTEGVLVTRPLGPSPAIVNDNNNTYAAAKPGPFANPTPGTIVVHINGRVNAGFKSIWSSADQRLFTAPAGSPGGPTIPAGAATSTATALGTNGVGPAKLAPDALYSYARIYLGADAMATNGLRYGAGIEIRENFSGEPSGASASVSSSLQTLFVRRAFTYLAGDQWGLVRLGQADGLISLFDNGVTTTQFLPTNNLQNGDDFAMLTPTNASVPFFFASGTGSEYANTKAVYLSPQIVGFDFGFQYAPNTSNGFGIGGGNNAINASLTGSGIGTGITCSVATTGCPTLSSGPGVLDGSRILNQTAIGVRYQGSLGDVGLLAYGVYEFSGHANFTGLTTASFLGNTVAGTTYNGKYDGLSFGNAGIALTYAGFTVGANVIGGRVNGLLSLTPQGGAPEVAYIVGVKYTAGPLVVGVSAEHGDYQGSVNLTGITQRRGSAIDFGLGYTVAPGYQVYAEYQYQTIYQGDFNFITNAPGSGANNTIKSQGLLLGNVVNF
jgi:predicted porin